VKLREDINKIRDHKADELRSQLSKLRVAYGSLISDPGDEIRSTTIETKKGVITPFKVEFARKSRSRKGAPTLVPVEQGGAQVSAWRWVKKLKQ
jgi:hypothetical protein